MLYILNYLKFNFSFFPHLSTFVYFFKSQNCLNKRNISYFLRIEISMLFKIKLFKPNNFFKICIIRNSIVRNIYYNYFSLRKLPENFNNKWYFIVITQNEHYISTYVLLRMIVLSLFKRRGAGSGIWRLTSPLKRHDVKLIIRCKLC